MKYRNPEIQEFPEPERCQEQAIYRPISLVRSKDSKQPPEGLRTEGKTHAGIGDAIDRMLGVTEEDFQKWRDGELPDNPRFHAAEKYAADLHHALTEFDNREANSILDKMRRIVRRKIIPEKL